MDRLFQALRPLIRGVVRRGGWVVLGALVLTGISLLFARHLHIDTDFSELLPPDYPSVQALEELRETVGAESDAAVAIVSPSFEANKRFAEALIPEALALTGEEYDAPYFTRVEYRRDTEFLENNALYFASDRELDRLEATLEEQIREAKLEANPFYFDLETEEAEPDTAVQELEATYERLVGTEYPISDDSTTMVLTFYPSGSQTDVGYIEDLYADLEALVDRLEPPSFHPEMEVALAGRLQRQLVEVRAITSDVFGSLGAGIGAVLLVVALYFFYKSYRARAGGRRSGRLLLAELGRAPLLALVIGLPLAMSLTWTAGFAYLAFQTLNLFTATLGLVLFGLGIEYGIHFYARYAEERAEGRAITEAVEVSFTSTGQAITASALATAAAFYVLMVADFKGFSQFGAVAGTGILFALVAMLVVIPALLALLEGVLGVLDLRPAAAPLSAVRRGRRYPIARTIVAGSLAAVAASLLLLPQAEFEYEFGKLEPEYEAYDARRAVVRRVTGGDSERRNPAYIVLDSPEEAPAVVAAVEAKMQQDTLSPTILDVVSLQERFPFREEAQQAKLDRIAEIRALLQNRYVQADTSETLTKLRRAAQTRTPITLEEVPDFLRKQFTTKTGAVGTFVMIYPSVGLSDARQSMAFADDVGTIVTDEGAVYHAGSTSLVAADMIELMQEEAPWMIGLTFVIVALLMVLNFRSLRWAALALVPLAVGILWMLLIMQLIGLRLNFYNIIVLPAVLGIGNDVGVHIVHRYREEGAGAIIRVLRSTGEHVTVGALTNAIGFGGLLLSFHPGLHSIGLLAVLGIGATLASALVFLPALLQWLEDRRRLPSDFMQNSRPAVPSSAQISEATPVERRTREHAPSQDTSRA